MTHPVPFLVRLPIVVAALIFTVITLVAISAPRTEQQTTATLNTVAD